MKTPEQINFRSKAATLAQVAKHEGEITYCKYCEGDFPGQMPQPMILFYVSGQHIGTWCIVGGHGWAYALPQVDSTAIPA